MPPAWFFWAWVGIFALMSPAFALPWLIIRRRNAERRESFVTVDGVVVDRVERTARRVEVTVEYRDHHGRVHRMTDDEGRFFRFVGDTTPVLYTRDAPADARLELNRNAERVFGALGVSFALLTVACVALALAA